MKSFSVGVVLILVMVLSVPAVGELAGADESVIEVISAGQLKQGLDTVWVLLAAFLVLPCR